MGRGGQEGGRGGGLYKDGGCKGGIVWAKLWAGVGACSEDVGCRRWEAGGAEGGVWGSALCPALPCPESPWVPLRVRILHQGRTLREVRANITVEVRPSPP